jgi:NADPH:quinone reductase
MKAMVVNQWGEPRDMKLVELPDPRPAPGQVAIDVRAIGCNFFDILMVQGKYQVRPAFPFSPGSEVAGVIREVGSGADGFAPGDRVLGMLGWGGFASVAVAPKSVIVRVPESMSFDHAAAFPIVYQTSYFGLVYRARLQPGDTLLVHAAAGGVGLAAVQIGRALGAHVLAAAGSPRKLEIAGEHGARDTIDYSQPGWDKRVMELTEGRGADVIYDPVGGDIFDLSTKCIAFGGRLLVVGFTSGRIPSIQANRILLKNISIVGLHWGAYRQHEPALIDRTFKALFDLYEKGGIRPVISASYPLADAAAALEEIGSRRSFGKLVLHP